MTIDPDLTRAESLDPRAYIDPAVLVDEKNKIFSGTWQLAAGAAQLAESGAYAALEVAGEPVVLVRDGETLRGFFNVCRHRAGPVARGCGRRQSLQCAYHGWTYGLDGRLLRAPEMEGAQGFHTDDVRLVPVAAAALGPLAFVNLDGKAPPLVDVLEGVTLPPMRHLMRREYRLACNWKVYVDNYLEGYHLPLVHPGLYRELDYAGYRVETRRFTSLQHAPLRPVAAGTERNYDPDAGHDAPLYVWIFPSTMLNLYQGLLQTNVVIPVGVGETVILFDWYAAQSPPNLDRLAGFSEEIQQEDIAICEAVQRNLRSRAAAPGRYSPRRENGVHHFHRLWQELMT